MKIETTKTEKLLSQFSKTCKLLTAIGDETRQLIMAVLATCDCDGLCVADLTVRTHLSRPAISHHLKILRDANVIGMEKQSTKHFYYLALEGEWQTLVSLVNEIENLRSQYAQEVN